MNVDQTYLTPEEATQVALERAIKDAFVRTFGAPPPGVQEEDDADASAGSAGPGDSPATAAGPAETTPSEWSGPEEHVAAAASPGNGEDVIAGHGDATATPEPARLAPASPSSAPPSGSAHAPTPLSELVATVSERSRRLVGDFGFRACQHGDAMAVAPAEEIEASRARFSEARRALLDHIRRLEGEIARLETGRPGASSAGTAYDVGSTRGH